MISAVRPELANGLSNCTSDSTICVVLPSRTTFSARCMPESDMITEFVFRVLLLGLRDAGRMEERGGRFRAHMDMLDG
jgi:hypothetical protein